MAERENMLILISSDKKSFEIEESAAKMSRTIANIIEEDVTLINGIPIPAVDGATLAKVVEFCNKHTETSEKTKEQADEKDDLADWDKEFLGTEFSVLFAIIQAANYLDIKSLFDIGCKTVADLIKDKSVEEIREIFSVQNDYTPEEEAELRRQNAWAFE